ncbi:putative DsbA family dithiol-disulfide isomerase [Pseudomonas sp. JUb42]|uniref:DsbA family oxidoreductase n=1 Tax=Pseudomonas sp. JUb42 TaxID=2940611 RepID=UPI0021675CD8|nr:DsbA family oxidoreductase [Pseudomonas sp. JUb42]MCS3470107.1 putative DsbA family dithiol-disulfide isomerase [Pseudomonas sp. JUb42]
MKKNLKIDFVSDVSCGWCAVALQTLEIALRNVGHDVTAEIHFQPFELNPKMSIKGENLTEHLTYKYGGRGAAQYFAGTLEQGTRVGFDFNIDSRSRIYNTFDAHRLLCWAGVKGKQVELKHALFNAHFSENKNPGDHGVLLACAEIAQLEVIEARQVLSSQAYSSEVRSLESQWRRQGVHAVPTVIINDYYIITGSRSVEVFEEGIRAVMDSKSTAVIDI